MSSVLMQAAASASVTASARRAPYNAGQKNRSARFTTQAMNAPHISASHDAKFAKGDNSIALVMRQRNAPSTKASVPARRSVTAKVRACTPSIIFLVSFMKFRVYRRVPLSAPLVPPHPLRGKEQISSRLDIHSSPVFSFGSAPHPSELPPRLGICSPSSWEPLSVSSRRWVQL